MGHLVFPSVTPKDDYIAAKAEEFLKNYGTLEAKHGLDLLLLHDKKSKAYYLVCHLDSECIAAAADLEAVLDPSEGDDYRFNRELYVDKAAYKIMERDALSGRSFEDLVVEYDTSYRADHPLKVFGGQHRVNAIITAASGKVLAYHGIRVYFCLTIEQKVEIASVSNTSIAVSNDLLDRMQEDLLGGELRTWCQGTGLLEPGQNFSDRRNPDGIPTVRIARTLVVNFFEGQSAEEGALHQPMICSSGSSVDQRYLDLRGKMNWNDGALVTAGKEFGRLHHKQREVVLNRKDDKHTEFANKAVHPCVAASWAYAAALFQDKPEALRNHYSLPDTATGQNDPLNARALSSAKLKGVDPETYRGLGARMNSEELGRMLEVFILQATEATKRGINAKVADAAIKSYTANRADHVARKAKRGL